MRVTPINNQIQNNKPAFGMAVKRINTAGMTNLEKQAVFESLPALKDLFTKIDGEIMLDTHPNVLGRQFKVFASNPENADKKVCELFSSGIHYHSGDKAGLSYLKTELFKNAESSISTYLGKSKNLGTCDELDKAIAAELKETQQRIADNVRTQTGLTATVESI